MNKYLMVGVFALLVSLHNSQESYSQESGSKVCMGDCMVIWSEEKDYGDEGSISPKEKEINPNLFWQEDSSLIDIFFDADQYTLDETAKNILKNNVNVLMNKDLYVEIQGHTDERGENLKNIELGDKRADAVKKYLVSLGADSKHLYTISYGEEKPFCMESNEKCWESNNRVHFMSVKLD
jgi:outer membrane protein OmpA-like peptidoglycan-associated protein